MLNKKPIIVNGFSRGGTNILMNILLSHPNVVMPSGELNKVFKGGGLGDGICRKCYKKICYDFVIRIICGNIFNRFSYNYRKNTPKFAQKYIDFILWLEKQLAFHEGHNKWKDKENRYKIRELRDGRMVVKAHDGLVYLGNMFREMYSDVKFVAVVRNGYAVCESMTRRGWKLEDAVNHYNRVGREILKNAESKDYLIIKLEDILNSPAAVIEEIYTHCELNSKDCVQFRFQHKAIAQKKSTKSILYGAYDRQLAWYDKKDLDVYFKPNVNNVQIEKLSAKDKEYIKNNIGDLLNKLGYNN